MAFLQLFVLFALLETSSAWDGALVNPLDSPRSFDLFERKILLNEHFFASFKGTYNFPTEERAAHTFRFALKLVPQVDEQLFSKRTFEEFVKARRTLVEKYLRRLRYSKQGPELTVVDNLDSFGNHFSVAKNDRELEEILKANSAKLWTSAMTQNFLDSQIRSDKNRLGNFLEKFYRGGKLLLSFDVETAALLYNSNPNFAVRFEENVFSDDANLFRSVLKVNPIGFAAVADKIWIFVEGSVKPVLRKESGPVYSLSYPATVVDKSTFVQMQGEEVFWYPGSEFDSPKALKSGFEKRCQGRGVKICRIEEVAESLKCNLSQPEFKCSLSVNSIKAGDGTVITNIGPFYSISTNQDRFFMQERAYPVASPEFAVRVPDSMEFSVGSQTVSGFSRSDAPQMFPVAKRLEFSAATKKAIAKFRKENPEGAEIAFVFTNKGNTIQGRPEGASEQALDWVKENTPLLSFSAFVFALVASIFGILKFRSKQKNNASKFEISSISFV